MKHNLLLLSIFALAISSCNIEQRFYFNEDFSGRMEQIIDYSAAADIMPPEEGTEKNEVTLLEDSVIESIKAEMAELDGIRLEGISDENYLLTVKLGFEHLEGLNQAMISNSGENEEHNIYCQFERRKKSLVIRFVVDKPEVTEEQSLEDSTHNQGSIDDQSFYELIKYRFSFEFEGKIKSYSGTTATLGDDGNSLVVEQTMKQMIADDFLSELEVVFK